jgi:hypothetical protein
VEVTHIILMHDDEISCRKKKCENKVLITPIDLGGNWRCSKCETKQKIADVEHMKITMRYNTATSTKQVNVERVLTELGSSLRTTTENAEIKFKKTSKHCVYRDEYCNMYMCLSNTMVGQCTSKGCPYMEGA